jgi:hypothetical protein
MPYAMVIRSLSVVFGCEQIPSASAHKHRESAIFGIRRLDGGDFEWGDVTENPVARVPKQGYCLSEVTARCMN